MDDKSLKESVASIFVFLGLEDVDLNAPLSARQIDLQVAEAKKRLALGAPMDAAPGPQSTIAMVGLALMAIGMIYFVAKHRAK